jgi:hypothetical protein
VAAGLGLAGCAGAPERPAPATPVASPDDFTVCHGYGCRERSPASLAPGEWAQVTALLRPTPADPAAERAALARALGRMETLVGARTGTAGDVGGTFTGFGLQGQLDCTDEATNTATYLRLFAAAGLVRHHEVDARVTRGWFLFGWPHVSATVRERGSGRVYAMDTWFHPNGHPAEVVPLEAWKDGWEPGDGGP